MIRIRIKIKMSNLEIHNEVSESGDAPVRDYKSELRELRTSVLKMQQFLKKEKISTLIIVTGFDGAGKGQIIHRFNEWLDPRTVRTHAFWQLSDEENGRPYFWRYWQCLPSKGRSALFFGSWYADLIADRVHEDIDDITMRERLETIRFFERMLVKDGVLLIKYWLHLSLEEQLSQKEDLEKNTQFHWKTQTEDWFKDGHYEKFWKTSEYVMDLTDQECARWIPIPAGDPQKRDFLVAEAFVKAVKKYPDETKKLKDLELGIAPVREPFRPAPCSSQFNPSDEYRIEKPEYEEMLPRLQSQLYDLAWEFYKAEMTTFLIFEGWDAAGKGGCIRRVVQSIDARLFDVNPVSAPTKEELAHHYLWRFWKAIPRSGRMAIFDRSWYGRVLVERVEGFASENEWKRSYEEIIDFESQLAAKKHLIMKFWLEITPETQLKRFEKRQEVPFKQFKIGPEDWRNRSKWKEYQEAVSDMIQKTNSKAAPWAIIPADNKRYARIHVLKKICSAMESALHT